MIDRVLRGALTFSVLAAAAANPAFALTTSEARGSDVLVVMHHANGKAHAHYEAVARNTCRGIVADVEAGDLSSLNAASRHPLADTEQLVLAACIIDRGRAVVKRPRAPGVEAMAVPAR